MNSKEMLEKEKQGGTWDTPRQRWSLLNGGSLYIGVVKISSDQIPTLSDFTTCSLEGLNRDHGGPGNLNAETVNLAPFPEGSWLIPLFLFFLTVGKYAKYF